VTRWTSWLPPSGIWLRRGAALPGARHLHGLPEKITIDKSGANTAAIKSVNGAACLDIELRQSKYLNNIVDQAPRAVKRIADPMMGFKSFWSAQKLISGTETMHMVKKGQLQCLGGQPMSVADQFYNLAF
jgi:putative transposase